MKAKLEFNLPEDATEFNWANKAPGMWEVIRDLDNWLRSEIKYTNSKSTKAIDERVDILHECRDKLREFIEDGGVGDLFV